eukprot:gene4451-3247_t
MESTILSAIRSSCTVTCYAWTDNGHRLIVGTARGFMVFSLIPHAEKAPLQIELLCTQLVSGGVSLLAACLYSTALCVVATPDRDFLLLVHLCEATPLQNATEAMQVETKLLHLTDINVSTASIRKRANMGGVILAIQLAVQHVLVACKKNDVLAINILNDHLVAIMSLNCGKAESIRAPLTQLCPLWCDINEEWRAVCPHERSTMFYYLHSNKARWNEGQDSVNKVEIQWPHERVSAATFSSDGGFAAVSDNETVQLYVVEDAFFRRLSTIEFQESSGDGVIAVEHLSSWGHVIITWITRSAINAYIVKANGYVLKHCKEKLVSPHLRTSVIKTSTFLEIRDIQSSSIHVAALRLPLWRNAESQPKKNVSWSYPADVALLPSIASFQISSSCELSSSSESTLLCSSFFSSSEKMVLRSYDNSSLQHYLVNPFHPVVIRLASNAVVVVVFVNSHIVISIITTMFPFNYLWCFFTYICGWVGLFSILTWVCAIAIQQLSMRYRAEWGVVTGASSGIGKAIAERLAQQGINVVLVALPNDLLTSTCEELKKKYPSVEFRSAGVDLGAKNEEYMDEIKVVTNDINVNLLFNNAGYICTGLFADTDEDRLRANMECNAGCAVPITHHFLRSMISRKAKGLITFTSSAAAYLPGPTATLYSPTKAFLTNFGASIAAENRDAGIHVVVMHPSPVNTNFYKNEGPSLDSLKSAQKAAASPANIAAQIFAAAGRITIWDQGIVCAGFRLAGKLLDFQILNEIVIRFAFIMKDHRVLAKKSTIRQKTDYANAFPSQGNPQITLILFEYLNSNRIFMELVIPISAHQTPESNLLKNDSPHYGGHASVRWYVLGFDVHASLILMYARCSHLLSKSSNAIKKILARGSVKPVLPTQKEEIQGSSIETSPFLLPGLKHLAETISCHPFHGSDVVPCEARPAEGLPLATIWGRIQEAQCAAEVPEKGSAPIANSQLPSKPKMFMPTKHRSVTCESTSTDMCLDDYCPTLETSSVQRAAMHVDIPRSLINAEALAEHLRTSTCDGTAALRLWHAGVHVPIDECEDGRSGIVARLKVSPSTARQRHTTDVGHVSDTQVSEVLSGGVVVSLNRPTLPHHVSDGTALRSALDASWRRVTSSAAFGTAHLHLVLYREGIALRFVIEQLQSVCSSFAIPQSIAVNLPLEDDMVSVQMCSIGVKFPLAEEAPERSLDLIYSALAHVNLRSAPFCIQIEGWKSVGCTLANSAYSQKLYSALIRHIKHRTHFVEGVCKKALTVFPNFYSPRSFGPHGCPFRSFHVVAALDAWRVREAMAMSYCLGVWPSLHHPGLQAPNWSHELLRCIRSTEKRPGVLLQRFEEIVPPSVIRFLLRSKDCLLWNLVASCRVHQLSLCGGDVKVLPPDEEDFVVSNPSKRVELLSHTDLNRTNCPFCSQVKVFNGVTDSAVLTLMDVVVPVLSDSSKNRFWEKLGQDLGFPTPRFALRREGSKEPHFRSLLSRATGFPYTAHAWVKCFTDSLSARGDSSEAQSSGPLFTLLTDLQLASASQHNFTSLSRGRRQQRAGSGAATQRGWSILDRLPAGFLASKAPKTRSDSSPKSIVMHCTFPPSTDWSVFAREVFIRSRRASEPQQWPKSSVTSAPTVPRPTPESFSEREARPEKTTTQRYDDGNICSIPTKYRSSVRAAQTDVQSFQRFAMTDWKAVKNTVEQEWDKSIIPALSKYIEIPNGSPHYDAEWATNGLMEKAFDVLLEWMKQQNIKGLTYEYIQEKGKTPFLIAEVAGSEPTLCSVLMYGHMDKQPPLPPWDEGLDPYKAVIRDGKLYGRGGADDGYAIFSAISSIGALQKHSIPHGRIVVIIEACEESGSFDLPYYMERTKDRIGDVDLMVCLDSGCMNYDQVWLTTSLRGVAGGVLRVQTLTQGMHSGVAGGVVPDSFRVARGLLDRIEDSKTGEIKFPEAFCKIPEHVVRDMESMNSVPFKDSFATIPSVQIPGTNADVALTNFWKPSLTVTGANLPECETAGNVIRTETALKLSLRVPPLVNAEEANKALQKVLEANPPHGAKVTYEPEPAGDGCATPEVKPWLAKALNEGSQLAFGNNYACQGMGGAIPFIAMLVKRYPKAQFVVTGILGPKSNAHGPNEFLHIPFSKGLTFAISRVLAEHFLNTPRK